MLTIIPVKQKKNYWCGPASLKMVLDYYKIVGSENRLAAETKADQAFGVKASSLLKVANQYGLKGFIKDNCELTDIRHYVLDKKIPVIVDWFQISDGHYSVVADINDSHIYLIDPYVGQLISMRLNKFYRIWFDFPGPYLTKKDNLILRRMIVLYQKHS